MKRAFGALLLLTLCACAGKNANVGTASSGSTSSPGASPASVTASTNPGPASASPSASYTDLVGTFGAKKILALAQLGVFTKSGGTFEPNAPIRRRTFSRWLFKANNAIWANDDAKQIRPATSGEKPAFKDVSATDPDFAYIQGLQDSGVSVGFPDKTFRPDAPLTREQMIAIKDLVDKGGVDPGDLKDPNQARFELPNWKDKAKIGIEYVPAINVVSFDDSQRVGNIGRAFGSIANFNPTLPVTRAQAALVLWKIGDHRMHSSGETSARTAAQALASQASPSASPSP